VETLRENHPDPALGQLSIADVIDHLVKTIQSLDEKPILIGYSFGGLLTQLMLQRDLGVAGVALDSAPPQGILSAKWSFVRSVWPGLNPFIPSSKPYYMSFEQFQYAFVHTLPLAEQRTAYDQQIVPESRRLEWGVFSSHARIDFKRARAPLLMIAGAEDRLIPASLNRTNYERYKKSPSVTEFKEFPGRVHYIIGQRGWEEVADQALAWAVEAQEEEKVRAA
jgi:pimeloyl-ACP methyl ester carboxylesterase